MPLIHDSHGAYHAEGSISAEDICAAAANIVSARAIGKGVILSNPKAAEELFKARLAHLEHEEFHVAFLDTQHRVIDVRMISRGTLDGAEVHPREVAKLALTLNASAILCSHNHPSFNPEPSAADRLVTARLKQALALIDVRLLDHIIVAGESVTSLASRGWV